MREFKAALLFIASFWIFVLIISFVMPFIDPRFHSFFQTFYWAIVTISTVGYGDVVPSTSLAKFLTSVMIIYAFLATSVFGAVVTARFIQILIAKLKEWEVMDNVTKHVIICGYNSQISILIKTFLEKELFPASRIVLIHKELNGDIEAIIEKYKIKFIEGDYSEEDVLKKAKAEEAIKAVLISDNIEDDTKVLSAAILLKDLNRNIYIIAEIANPKFQVYLKKIHCDEIVLSKEYNSFLIAKSTLSPGVSKVIGELLKADNFYIIRYYGEKTTYKHLFETMLRDGKILIGIVENYGRAGEFIKEFIEEVKREAKYVSELAKYLEEIKHKELNKVILKPSDDYVVNKFCGLIILRSENERASYF